MSERSMNSPVARRNDVARAGQEVLVLRHHRLAKGMHEAFVEGSRGVWLVYEKIGARIVGDFKVIHPDGAGPSEFDEGYRLVRYASFEHWQDTRRPVGMMGDGPLLSLSRAGGQRRRTFQTGSDGAFFLTGAMAPDGPYHLPGLDEDYEVLDAAAESTGNSPRPVRYDAPIPGAEVITLRYWKIQKGAFETFHEASLNGVWPYFQKIGARVIGQWKVIHPPPPAGNTTENPEFDEVLMMTRYASYQHWQATRDAVALGGDGPDYQAYREALRVRGSMSTETWVKFLQGELYLNPPMYTPALPEVYKLREPR